MRLLPGHHLSTSHAGACRTRFCKAGVHGRVKRRHMQAHRTATYIASAAGEAAITSTAAGAAAAAAASPGPLEFGSDARPKRGVIILPGLGNNAADYADLAARLAVAGVAVEVANVSRLDWSRNAAALTDANWWRGKLNPRPAVNWYLTKVDDAMQALKRRVDGAPISMLTHSAGGWLGRVYMHGYGYTGVDRFVSLGSPHQPPPAGVVDQTRGILTFCNDTMPGAYHEQVKYTTVAGKFIKGAKLTGPGSALAKFAGAGYQQVCGEAEVWGDFIVPTTCAHLEGSLQIDLEGVFHSPIGEQLSMFGPWYGSEAILPIWLPHLLGSEKAEDVLETGMDGGLGVNRVEPLVSSGVGVTK